MRAVEEGEDDAARGDDQGADRQQVRACRAAGSRTAACGSRGCRRPRTAPGRGRRAPPRPKAVAELLRRLDELAHPGQVHVHRDAEHHGGDVGGEHRRVAGQAQVDERLLHAQLLGAPEQEEDDRDDEEAERLAARPSPSRCPRRSRSAERRQADRQQRRAEDVELGRRTARGRGDEDEASASASAAPPRRTRTPRRGRSRRAGRRSGIPPRPRRRPRPRAGRSSARPAPAAARRGRSPSPAAPSRGRRPASPVPGPAPRGSRRAPRRTQPRVTTTRPPISVSRRRGPSPSRPITGEETTPTRSVAVSDHWAALSETPRSSLMLGISGAPREEMTPVTITIATRAPGRSRARSAGLMRRGAAASRSVRRAFRRRGPGPSGRRREGGGAHRACSRGSPPGPPRRPRSRRESPRP